MLPFDQSGHNSSLDKVYKYTFWRSELGGEVEKPNSKEEIPRHCKNSDDYIKRMFGKDFEFSEQYLVSDIDPRLIKRAIRKRYNFKKVTRVTVKHILYEGARSNNILRINDACYEKMVEWLGLSTMIDKSWNESKHIKPLHLDTSKVRDPSPT